MTSITLVNADEEEILADCAEEDNKESLDDAAFFYALRKSYANELPPNQNEK